MSAELSGGRIRELLLEVVKEFSTKEGHFQQNVILKEAAHRLGIARERDSEQALLTAWHDLFRNGHLAWGFDLSNPDSPFCHTTERGRETLRNISRDPANPDGYIAAIKVKAPALNLVAMSYICEAVRTYNANCFKATAVMVGCAAESLVLELRDELVKKIEASGTPAPKKLNNRSIRTVLKAMETEIDGKKTSMDWKLLEAFEGYWPAFTTQIRTIRNDAGHPTSVDPVSDQEALASLLTFPLLAVLIDNLRTWVQKEFK